MRYLVAILLVAVLAGCADSAAQDNGLVLGDGSKITVDPASSGKGALGGVIVDEAIRPIAGANVTLTNAGRTATSDAKGVFTWSDLDPGTYFVSVSAPGFLPTQSSAEVAAGKTAFVKVMMLRDNSPQPFHTSYKHDGFMQAWGGIAQYFVENVAATGSCDCRIYFQPDANVSTFIYEAFWKSSTPDPAGLAEFYWILEEADGELDEADYCFSPCYAVVDGKGYSGSRVMARLDGPDFWVAAQQSIRIIVTTWHNGPAPDGWSIATPS